MKISQVVVLSNRGDVLIDKKYRFDVPSNTADIFFNKYKGGSELLPSWQAEGVWFYHIKRNNMFFIATSKYSGLPILVVELLTKIYHIFKDFCGVVTEDSIRENLVLIYELLDEIIDFGQVQIASTSKLKAFIQSDPVLVKSEMTPEIITPGLFGIEHRVAPSYAADKPVVPSRSDQERRKNEIFVDVIERLNILINSDGTIARCDITGKINMKSILVGCPLIKLALNADLAVGKEENDKSYGHQAHIDEASFHSSVDTSEFGDSRLLKIHPTDGEFSLMTYQLSGNTPKSLPFRVIASVDDSRTDLELNVKVQCDVPSGSQAVNVSIKIPVPGNTKNITQLLNGSGQTASLATKEKHIIWSIKSIPGGAYVSAKFKIISSDTKKGSKLQVGPIGLEFEISSFVCSNLKIQYLRVFDKDHSYVPYRWVRYITCSDSYVIKL